MPSLEILDIGRNKIKRLPSEPGSLVNLRVSVSVAHFEIIHAYELSPGFFFVQKQNNQTSGIPHTVQTTSHPADRTESLGMASESRLGTWGNRQSPYGKGLDQGSAKMDGGE